MPLIQVFIATYNRPSLVINAVLSALRQNFDSYEVIVSDNSTNDETETLISQIGDKRLFYKKRVPTLPVIDHLNAILQDVTSDYFMIFHDDDIMYPNMLSTLHHKVVTYRKIIAGGSNAICENNGKSYLYNSNLKQDLIVLDKNELIRRYLLYDIVPFPSYLYKRVVAEELRFDINQGGKYCDASFIISLLDLGPIIFTASPLMKYYIHSGQDSAVNEFSEKLKLINFYLRNSDFKKKHPLLVRFRIQNIFVELKSKINQRDYLFLRKRNIKLIWIIFSTSPFEYFPRILYALMKRIIHKEDKSNIK